MEGNGGLNIETVSFSKQALALFPNMNLIDLNEFSCGTTAVSFLTKVISIKEGTKAEKRISGS